MAIPHAYLHGRDRNDDDWHDCGSVAAQFFFAAQSPEEQDKCGHRRNVEAIPVHSRDNFQQQQQAHPCQQYKVHVVPSFAPAMPQYCWVDSQQQQIDR